MNATFYDLPPEVIHLIFGYTSGTEVLDIASLFRKVIPIGSKHLLHNLHEYVQETPLDIDQSECKHIDARARAVAWACDQKVKLKNGHFVFRNFLQLCIVEHVLRSCDISHMDSVALMNYGLCDANDMDRDEQTFSLLAMKQGFPFIVAYKNSSPMHVFESIADLIISHAKELGKITLVMDLRLPNIDWAERLLQQVRSLQDVSLHGFSGWWESDLAENIHTLFAVLEQLPHLKRLELVNISASGQSFHFASQTLEELDMHRCLELSIQECNCPNLQILCLPLHYRSRLVSPLGEEDEYSKFPYGLEISLMDDIIPSWKGPSDICIHLAFEVNPIRGYVCKDTCTMFFIPQKVSASFDANYYGSDSQDEDYDYNEDDQDFDDEWYDEDEWAEENDELDNYMMSAEEAYEYYNTQAFF
jgi:hypothetical protein